MVDCMRARRMRRGGTTSGLVWRAACSERGDVLAVRRLLMLASLERRTLSAWKRLTRPPSEPGTPPSALPLPPSGMHRNRQLRQHGAGVRRRTPGWSTRWADVQGRRGSERWQGSGEQAVVAPSARSAWRRWRAGRRRSEWRQLMGTTAAAVYRTKQHFTTLAISPCVCSLKPAFHYSVETCRGQDFSVTCKLACLPLVADKGKDLDHTDMSKWSVMLATSRFVSCRCNGKRT